MAESETLATTPEGFFSSLFGWYALGLNIANLGLGMYFAVRDSSTGGSNKYVMFTFGFMAIASVLSQSVNTTSQPALWLSVYNMGANLFMATIWAQFLKRSKFVRERKAAADKLNPNHYGVEAIKQIHALEKISKSEPRRGALIAAFKRGKEKQLIGMTWKDLFDVWVVMASISICLLIVTFGWLISVLVHPNKENFNAEPDLDNFRLSADTTWKTWFSFTMSWVMVLCALFGRSYRHYDKLMARRKFMKYQNNLRAAGKEKERKFDEAFNSIRKVADHATSAESAHYRSLTVGTCTDNFLNIISLVLQSRETVWLIYNAPIIIVGLFGSIMDLVEVTLHHLAERRRGAGNTEKHDLYYTSNIKYLEQATEVIQHEIKVKHDANYDEEKGIFVDPRAEQVRRHFPKRHYPSHNKADRDREAETEERLPLKYKDGQKKGETVQVESSDGESEDDGEGGRRTKLIAVRPSVHSQAEDDEYEKRDREFRERQTMARIKAARPVPNPKLVDKNAVKRQERPETGHIGLGKFATPGGRPVLTKGGISWETNKKPAGEDQLEPIDHREDHREDQEEIQVAKGTQRSLGLLNKYRSRHRAQDGRGRGRYQSFDDSSDDSEDY